MNQDFLVFIFEPGKPAQGYYNVPNAGLFTDPESIDETYMWRRYPPVYLQDKPWAKQVGDYWMPYPTSLVPPRHRAAVLILT